jgi:short-subunit dehydrogenase
MGAARPWKLVWITGASSGIGQELAENLARSGVIVAASARSTDKLAAMAAANPNIKPYPLDVSDSGKVKEIHAAIERDLGPVDLAILNAGIWQQMIVSDFSAARGMESMTVNYFGVINALEPAMAAFVARGKGHVALVSSVAGYRGVMRGAAYSPTKSALIALAEALYPHLLRKGVKLTIIVPGYVKTPMTDVNAFPMPFMVPVEEAAKTILSGLARGKYEIIFPWKMALLMKTLRILPHWMFFTLVNIAINKAGTGDPPSPKS